MRSSSESAQPFSGNDNYQHQRSQGQQQQGDAPRMVNVRLADIIRDSYSGSSMQYTSNPPQQEVQAEPSMSTSLVASEHAVQVKLSDMVQSSSTTIYSSVKSFEELGLSPELLNGLYYMGFSKPSKIQETALPLMLSNPPQNLIGQSQSGTGKSAAFILAMLSRIDQSMPCPQAICLTPSRELTRQISSVVETMARFTSITTISLIKDSFNKHQGEEGFIPKNKPITNHIIIGTPGTILDCIRRPNTILDTTHLKVLVLDEADNMLDQSGLGDQSIRIKRYLKSTPQLLLFSATFPDHVYQFAHKFAQSPHEITLRKEELNVDTIKQYYMDCNNEEHKYIVLCNIYNFLTVSQSIIFCKRRDTADKISQKMINEGHNVNCIHGGMTSAERDKIIDDFRRGEFKVLITTNLISRGIDISQVSLVVNYDLPLDRTENFPDPDVYLHRIGRTGRFGRVGVSIIFVHNHETFRHMRYLEEHFRINIERVPTEDWEEVERIFKEVL